MTPTIVHRYTFPIRDAIEQLLGEAAGDCDAWRIRVEADELVIDVVAPAPTQTRPASNQTAKINMPEKRKGGALATRAGIICNERGFWTFSETGSAEEATAWLRRECGVASRADLDHEPAAAEKFHDVDRRYRLWLEGYD